jgi:hypothetical protein
VKKLAALFALFVVLMIAAPLLAAGVKPIDATPGLYVVEVKIEIPAENICKKGSDIGTIYIASEFYGPFRSVFEAQAWADDHVIAGRIGTIGRIREPFNIIESRSVRQLPRVTPKKARP